MRKLFYFLLIILLYASCGENEVEAPDNSIFGYEYFPLDVGYAWEYQVDSLLVTLSGNGNIESSSFVRDRIIELKKEDGDYKEYTLERSYRKTTDDPWAVTDLWTISVDFAKAYRTEENLRFIKLVFPALEGARWDGNAFFDADAKYPVAADNITVYQGWQYKIESVDQPRNVGDLAYDEVLHVSHIDNESFISKRFSEEYYARGVGLVERTMEIYETQNGNTELDWADRAESGFMLKQILLSFKKS